MKFALPKWRWPRWTFRWSGRRSLTWACLALVLFLLIPEELWARRGGRVSFGRSSSFSRRSYSTPSRAKSWGNSRPSNVTPRMGTRSQSRPTTTTRRSSVDAATLNRARTQGTVFNSRSDAERAFQRDYQSRFPTRFDSQPSSRPNYIPQTTTVDGQRYSVDYNPRYGSYGYMRNGSWTAFDVMRDVALMNLLMRQNAYVYPGAAARSGTTENADVQQSGDSERPSSGFGFGMGSGLLILLLIIGAWAMIPRRRGSQRYYQGQVPPIQPAMSTQPNREPRMTAEFDLHSARFWRQLKPGSTVILKDEQTLQDMIDSGEALASGRDYNVDAVWRIRESRDVAEWQFFRIRSQRDEDNTWLLIKSAGDQISAGVYFEADGFDAGTRRDILNQELFWVFNEPRDPNNYKLLDLNYATHLYFNVDLNGEAREAEFAKIGDTEFHGNASADPPMADNDRMMGTVAEYETMLPVPNPRVLFFEVGTPKADGGLIRMLQGAEIRMGDLEVLPVQGNAAPPPPPLWNSTSSGFSRKDS